MKHHIVLLIISLPFFVNAQNKATNIFFKPSLTWEQVKIKAQAENKYIFVDCYATWCKPCKEMDKEVYINDSVEKYMSDNFVSIKVQMDSTKNDNESVKKVYSIARQFEKKYKIKALPTFLFFSPEGRIVHKDEGRKTVNQFIALVSEVKNPENQLYSLIDNWKQGKVQYSALPELVKKLKRYAEDSFALEVGRDYLHHYLEKLSESDYLKKENLFFIKQNRGILNSKDRIFEFFYKFSSKVDSAIAEKGFSTSMINSIIYTEQVLPHIKNAIEKNSQPDWKKITANISGKYTKTHAYINVLKGKTYWFKYKNDWENYTKCLTRTMKNENLSDFSTQEIGTVLYLNSVAFDVFIYSNSKSELNEALRWSNYAVSLNKKAFTLDTKANLLYKLGKRREALNLYRDVIKLSPGYLPIYKCMEAGLPTWLNAIWPRKMARKIAIATNLQDQVKKQNLKESSIEKVKVKFASFMKQPDFSGSWAININKSEFGALPEFAAAKMFIILQEKDSMQVERFNIDQENKQTHSKEIFSLDGKPNTYLTETNQKKTVVANWSEGGKVLSTFSVFSIIDKPNEIEVSRTQKWGLSEDGKTLIVEQVTEPSGNYRPYTIIAVYDKQKK